MLKSNNVFVSNIRIFHGRNGSSARVNISSDDVPNVEIEDFWPDGISCRKWVPHHEYTRDTAPRKRSRYDHSNDNEENHYSNYARRPDRHYYDTRYDDSDKEYTSRNADDRPYSLWNTYDCDSEIWN